MICLYCRGGDHHLCSGHRRSGEYVIPPLCECGHTVAEVLESNLKYHDKAGRTQPEGDVRPCSGVL